MGLEKTTRMNYLFDFYQELLTPKQRSYMSLYYLDDHSLGEIAEEYEILLVNDDSHDSSGDIINQLSKKYERVKGIHLMRNYGQHNALLCGIRRAKNELIVTLDDDLQNPPEEIPKMLDKLNQGYDVVYGTPENEKRGVLRNFTSVITKSALNLAMGAKSAKHVSSFRIFRKNLSESFKHFDGSFVCIDVLLTWGTTNFGSVIVKHDHRKIGKSNYSFIKLLVHALNMITGFSVIPLKIASVLGIVFALFGLFILIIVIGQFLLVGSPVQGFTLLASIISIFSGVQLLSMGIIGEYLARMHFNLSKKPVYTIERINN